MFIELIATFAAGLGAAGIALLLNRLSGGRLPSWLMPVLAGLAMIATTVANEYSWGRRTTEGLPNGIVVIEKVTQTAWYRPWTYLAPQTVRMVALDQGSIQSKADTPEVKLVDLYLFARWQPPALAPQLVDCAAEARADVTEAALQDPGLAQWQPAGTKLIDTACAG